MHTRFVFGQHWWTQHEQVRTILTHLIPDADVTLTPFVSRVKVRTLSNVIAEELEKVFAFFVPQTFEVSDSFWINVKRLIPG